MTAATIAILALQGAFAEHAEAFRRLGQRTREIRSLNDLNEPFDALVLPGGESTTQGKLLKELGLFEPLKAKILRGLPVLATCAGVILLATRLEEDKTVWFGTLDATVRRNAYGRQLGSFHTTEPFDGLGPLPMTFIRAPIITQAGPKGTVLATCDGKITAIRQDQQLALTFHPELGEDLRLHRYFLETLVLPQLAKEGNARQ